MSPLWEEIIETVDNALGGIRVVYGVDDFLYFFSLHVAVVAILRFWRRVQISRHNLLSHSLLAVSKSTLCLQRLAWRRHCRRWRRTRYTWPQSDTWSQRTWSRVVGFVPKTAELNWQYFQVTLPNWSLTCIVAFVRLGLKNRAEMMKVEQRAGNVTTKNAIKSSRSRTRATLRHLALRRSALLALRWWRSSVESRSHCDTNSHSSP